jgi:hypothetical protein
MSDVSMCNHLLDPGPSVSPHAVFWAVAKQNLAVEQQIQAQNDGVSSHNTLSEAA